MDCQNERVMQCRNCDEWGHSGKECPKPKDWSRVKCTNCQEMGHGAKRCPNPTVEVPEESGGGGGGDWDNGGATNGASGG
jgi:cellular nucleic acid-binding protein